MANDVNIILRWYVIRYVYSPWTLYHLKKIKKENEFTAWKSRFTNRFYIDMNEQWLALAGAGDWLGAGGWRLGVVWKDMWGRTRSVMNMWCKLSGIFSVFFVGFSLGYSSLIKIIKIHISPLHKIKCFKAQDFFNFQFITSRRCFTDLHEFINNLLFMFMAFPITIHSTYRLSAIHTSSITEHVFICG